jgi:hypothetical protein
MEKCPHLEQSGTEWDVRELGMAKTLLSRALKDADHSRVTRVTLCTLETNV